MISVARCPKISDKAFTSNPKETPKGVSTMSKAMEERLKENSYLCSIDFASKLLMKGDYTFDVIAELTGLPLEDVQELAAEQENSEQN